MQRKRIVYLQVSGNLRGSRIAYMEREHRLFAQTAKMLLDRDVEDVQSIVTFCESLDNALGGGIPLGQMTECAGPSGIGKTQLCLQLAVDVCIPKVLGGVDGEVIYIDTEGAFKYKRLKQIAEAAVSHCRRVAETEEQQTAADGFTLSKILSRIFLVNQITTRFGEDGEPFTVPSVGPLLTSNCAQQLLLFHRQGKLRYARLTKSSSRPPCGAIYTVTRNVVVVVVAVDQMSRRGLSCSRRLVDDAGLGVDGLGQIWKRGVQFLPRAVQQRRHTVEQAGGVHHEQHVLHRLGHRFDEVVVLQLQILFHEVQNVQPQIDERVERRQRHQVLQEHLAGHGQRPYACLVHADSSSSSVVVVVVFVVVVVVSWRGPRDTGLLVGAQQRAQQREQHPVEATFPIVAGDLLQFRNQHRPLQECHRRRAHNSAPVAAQPRQCLQQRLPTSRPQCRCGSTGRVEQRRHFDENQISQIQQLQRQLQPNHNFQASPSSCLHRSTSRFDLCQTTKI
ncbi:DNA repair protein RAD51 -like protein 3 [Trichinella pseudospiralis]|uniref:DNA repair protein RAD51 homolog 3 n=1 Tax=Trichinella pseudospiralis TaxID=6337 RepID=A0A0V1JII8_TRIPS|nr:DNA repair protein RAD51 -like protein 3 [Trichinella pseudospiralis]